MKIEAGRALVRRAAELLTGIEQDRADPGEATRAVNQAQVHAAQASVAIGSNLFRLCGARATSSRFNADMYWRNARTLTLHDTSTANSPPSADQYSTRPSDHRTRHGDPVSIQTRTATSLTFR